MLLFKLTVVNILLSQNESKIDFKRKVKHSSATVLISTFVAKYIDNKFRITFRGEVMDANSDRDVKLYIRIEI